VNDPPDKTLRVGTLCYDTWQGLGVLAHDFYKHSIVTDPVVVAHGRHPANGWYPSAPLIRDLRRDVMTVVGPVLDDVDVMLFFETPFAWELLPECKRRGVKTVIMPMHECMPAKVPHHPDLWLCPSLLDYEWACRACGVQDVQPRHVLAMCSTIQTDQHGHGPDIWFLPVPVDTDAVPFRQRTEARVFVHNAGHGGLKGRNGTRQVLDALRLVRSGANFIIRSQQPVVGNGGLNTTLGGGRITYHTGTVLYEDLFTEGDVFLFPEAFNGLSLPLQAGNRFPVNTWLHDDALIPVERYTKERIGPPYSEYDRAHYDPKEIAAKIDQWYGKDITEYSRMGREWADAQSWRRWGKTYRNLLAKLVAEG
jgi:hypothetical protein